VHIYDRHKKVVRSGQYIQGYWFLATNQLTYNNSKVLFFSYKLA